MSNFITTVTIRARTWVISLKQFLRPTCKILSTNCQECFWFWSIIQVCMNTSSFIARSKSKLAYNSQNSCRILSIYYYFIIMPRRKHHLYQKRMNSTMLFEWYRYWSDDGYFQPTQSLNYLPYFTIFICCCCCLVSLFTMVNVARQYLFNHRESWKKSFISSGNFFPSYFTFMPTLSVFCYEKKNH